MASLTRFLALLRYQLVGTPLIWTFPLVFALISFCNMVRYPGSIELSAGPCITLLFAALIFRAEIFSRGGFISSAAANPYLQGTEFLRSCAVEKWELFWSRFTIYWLLVLATFVFCLIGAFIKPSFSLVLEPDRVLPFFEAFPGSSMQGITRKGNHLLFLLHGNIWLELSQGILLMFTAAATLFFIFLTITLKWRRYWFWGIFTLAATASVASTLMKSGFLWQERMILASLQHPLAFLIALVPILAAVSWFCMRRFMDAEVES